MNFFELEKHNKYFITECSDIEILETLKLSHRIKLVCFDVSQSYIILGANNGSIYIYQRVPSVTFFKLIPSKSPTSIRQILISPNEKNIVITDDAGIISILENCFYETYFITHAYLERKGKNITALKWDGDDKLYIGDEDGVVSVISIPTLVSLPLLHTPFVSLMELSSPIVQMDTFSRFMLITTEKKTFVCDTEREMYKQVGKTDKGKSLGSCFYNIFDVENPELIENYNEYKLFCTRPGLKLWESNFEGEVLCTHKYKNSTSDIYEIIKFCENTKHDQDLETIEIPQMENKSFGKVYVFNKKYLCVVNNNDIFLIDPQKNYLLFYFNSVDPISVKLVNNHIFIWNHTTEKLKTLRFQSFEELLAEMIESKQFKMAVQLVVRYRNDVINWSKSSYNVSLVENLKKSELMNNLNEELIQEFEQVLKEIRNFEKQKLLEYSKNDDPKINNNGGKEPIQTKISDEQTIIKNKFSEEFEIMTKQYSLNGTSDKIVIPQYSNLMLKLDENEMTELFINFTNYLEKNNEKIDSIWFCNQYLHYFNLKKGPTKLSSLNHKTLDFLEKCVLETSSDEKSFCSCKFPLPFSFSNKSQLKHADIEFTLMEHSENYKYLLEKIPHLWHFKIEKMDNFNEFEQHLPLILQLGYLQILNKFKKQLSYDHYDNLVDLFVKLKSGKCVNCDRKIPEIFIDKIPNWEQLGLILIPLIHADNVLKLFLNRHQFIPKDELTEKFYMTCMFSKLQCHSGGKNGELLS